MDPSRTPPAAPAGGRSGPGARRDPARETGPGAGRDPVRKTGPGDEPGPARPPTPAGTVDIRPFEDDDADGVAALARAVMWPSVSDPEVVRHVCAAPGATAYVAATGGEVVGWAQALGDGLLQSHLSFLAVHPRHRRRGIGRLLVMATFQATGTKRMDLVSDAAHPFYESFAHRRMGGYRIYPGA